MKRADFLVHMRQILLRRRDALCRSLDSELDLLQRTEDVADEFDEAQGAEGDEVSVQLAQCESRELSAVVNALKRIQLGFYGICEECDRNITMTRLQALPYATLCIHCKRDLERDGRAEVQRTPIGPS